MKISAVFVQTILVVLILSSVVELHGFQMASLHVLAAGESGLSDCCSGITLSWTSYEVAQPTLLENSSFITGNSIMLNASAEQYLESSLNICNTSISLFIDGGGSVSNITNGTSTTLLVPWLSYNITGRVHIESFACNGSKLDCSYTNLTFGNSFYPKLSDISVSHTDGLWTITWSASDNNIGDSLKFDVLMSPDDGVTYVYIAMDLNTSSFGWNSTGFPKSDLAFLVRATDSRGLIDEIEYYSFTGTGIPTSTTPAITSSGDLEFVQGTTGHFIMWTISRATHSDYSILQNGIEVETGTLQSGVIEYCVDGLPAGEYTFVLRIGFLDSDPVTVLVLVNWPFVALQITICSAVGVVIVIAIRYYARRYP